MPDAILLYGSPAQEFDLFHAVPAPIGDPFLYVESDGRRVALVTVLDADIARAAGVDVLEIYVASCRPFEAAGQPTLLTKPPGEVLEDGYFHGLGHGVGLEVHERPNLSRVGDELVAGDVITLEPGCYRRGFGGCRLEDLVLVTDTGYEVLTDFPYDL